MTPTTPCTGRVDPGAINGVVLLTDGYNEDESNNDRNALLEHLAGDRRVHVYTIALGSDADVSTLKRIATATNGAYYGATNPINIETRSPTRCRTSELLGAVRGRRRAR